MYRVFIFLLSAMSLATSAAAAIIDSQVFINEFHYDNVGADQNEFIEVAAPESWVDLSSVAVTLYNGSSGSVYGGPTSLSDFQRGGQADGFVFYTFDTALQNGAPDGLALSWNDDVLQFLSYEGTFLATEGVAQGLMSTDIGVQETTSTPLGWSLQLAGSGDSYLDFAWQVPAANTYGDRNHNQSFTVPEPGSLVLWACAIGATGFGCWRRRRCRLRRARSS